MPAADGSFKGICVPAVPWLEKCKYGDPHCPCQDGDPCHYEPCGDTPAWKPPTREALQQARYPEGDH